jgi:hypothetical protein
MKAHHGRIDAADLLDIEGAVREALAVQQQQRTQRAVDEAVGDEGERR